MQIVFFARESNLLELLASLQEETLHFWYGQDLSNLALKSIGVLFFDYDDPEFDLMTFQDLITHPFHEERQFQIVLLSAKLSVKEAKSLQNKNNFIEGLVRKPIKLKDIESFVEDYKLVQLEMRVGMDGAKKKDFEDPVSAKIQRKFDLVFKGSGARKISESKGSTVFNDGIDNVLDDDDFNLGGESSMSESAKKPSEPKLAKIELDFDMGGELEFSDSSEVPPIPSVPEAKDNPTKLAVVPDDNGLDFSLDFSDDAEDLPIVSNKAESASAAKSVANENTESDSDFELDFSNLSDENPAIASLAGSEVSEFKETDGTSELDAMFDAELENANELSGIENDGTQKTIVYDKAAMPDHSLNILSDDNTESTNSTADLMTTDEARANIESTIKDILRPKNLESTQEFDVSNLSDSGDEIDFGSTDVEKTANSTGEFDLSNVEFADLEDEEDKVPMNFSSQVSDPVASAPKPVATTSQEVIQSFQAPPTSELERSHTSFVSDEESTRLHATIRQMREEREELLAQIKTLKGDSRELEQDNLTLKAALDESKIEVSILRKRHMVELEDIKYRLSLNEEKKVQAIEKAKVAEGKREKLEQRVRIDFNQVKQREKELETKLEMLSIDVDSQVQSRDQKILELRRKIDSLEFNMENVSIKEQKSQDDKRKLEDKLNKIMKTLRHSIKNLEDDIDQVSEDGQDDKENGDHRSKA